MAKTPYRLLAALTGTTDKAPQMAIHRGDGAVTVRMWLEKWLVARLAELKRPMDAGAWVQPNDIDDRILDRAIAFLKEAILRLGERVTLREKAPGGRKLVPWTAADLSDVVVLEKAPASPMTLALQQRILAELGPSIRGLSETTRKLISRLMTLVAAVVNVLSDKTPCPPKGRPLSVVRTSLWSVFPWLKQRLSVFPGLELLLSADQ